METGNSDLEADLRIPPNKQKKRVAQEFKYWPSIQVIVGSYSNNAT